MKPLALLPLSALLLATPAASADLDGPVYRDYGYERSAPPRVVERDRIVEHHHHHHHYAPPRPFIASGASMWSRRSITGPLVSTPTSTNTAMRMPAGGVPAISSLGTTGTGSTTAMVGDRPSLRSGELIMIRIAAIALSCSLLALAAVAQEKGKSETAPGQTGKTPGQMQKQPGQAKDYAPGSDSKKSMNPPGQSQADPKKN